MKTEESSLDYYKNEDHSFEKEKSDEVNDNFDLKRLSSYKFPFDEHMDLDNFLSKKIDEMVEVDFICDFEKNENEKEKNIEIEKISKKHIKGYEEILGILKKAWGDKNLTFKNSPFKRLIKPKQLSLDGKILLNVCNINKF